MSNQLRQLGSPSFHFYIGSCSEFADLCWSIAEREPDLAVRMVRGVKMQTLQGLDDEVSAAFQFPYYFGENWDALSECLSDLSWLPAAGYVMAISNSTNVLSQEGPQELPPFFRILAAVIHEWNTPINRGEWWDRPGKPFHVVLHACPEHREELFGILNRMGIRPEALGTNGDGKL